MKRILVIFGTRPEARELCPLIIELKKKLSIQTIVCTTKQHKKLLDQILSQFKIATDYHLSIMTEG